MNVEWQIESWKRRGFLQSLACVGVACPWIMSERCEDRVFGSEPPGKLARLSRFPRMTQEWLVDQVRHSLQGSREAQKRLSTREDALAYVQSCRERAKLIFGPLPEKTPLYAKTTKSIERDQYWIENVLFQSRPEFYVTANLYLPKSSAKKLPAVVGTCGHSNDGKANKDYQAFAQGLAKLGYVVLIYDPIGQGERLQYPEEPTKSQFKGAVGEHIQMGNQQSLVGEFLGQWFAWDGIRAIDYLLEREEVDQNQIAITGNSGGGTQTTWICSLDERLSMAAPACFITSFQRNAENELPADTEQCPPRALALGMDHCDFLMAMAPKPLVILAKERDYFDIRGTKEAFDRLQHVYRLLGKEDLVRLVIGEGYHGYTQDNREAMYRFFQEQLGRPAIEREPSLSIESEDTLRCTQRGSVLELGSKTVSSLTKEKARRLASNRSPKTGTALKQAIRDTLKLAKESEGPIEYRILRDIGNRAYPAKFCCTYAVGTEQNIQAIVTMLSEERQTSRPKGNGGPACLYVSHRSADSELREEGWLTDLFRMSADVGFFACDVRGIGESRPDTCGLNTFDDPYGSDYFHAAHGLMLDRPLLGQRVFDALRVIDWILEHGFTQVHLCGKGWGAIVATLAAVLSEKVHRVSLLNGLESFQSIAEVADYDWPYSMLPPNVLEFFDLPDCYRDLQSKGLVNQSPWTALDGRR